MPQILVAGGLVTVFLMLWFSTSRIGHRKKSTQAQLMQRENLELRHVVTEMAKERHSQQSDDRRGKSR